MTPPPLVAVLRHAAGRAAPVVPFDLRAGGFHVFDFTADNPALRHVGINDVTGFTEHLFSEIAAAKTPVGIGRYNEDRVLYRHSPLFDGDAERRSIHLGMDLFVVEGTAVLAPLPAQVHSLADNDRLGDYGPTVILGHEVDGVRFFTLYGHLSRATLDELEAGRRLEAGDVLGWVGDHHENGGWPPHLHFQIIADLQGRSGDFPGVAAPSERERFLELCPDPNLLLGVPGL